MTFFNHPEFKSHEHVAVINDESTGLRALIAIHDTRLGPAVGGCRMYPYTSDDDALTDVLRLSRGMTYKSALAGLPFGGGKSVILGDPRHQKTPAMMRAMGIAVERLGGRYVIAEDSGTSPTDLRLVAESTRHVSGIEDNAAGGDPSPSTAYGVFLGIKRSIRLLEGTDDLGGKTVAIQGLGHVGYHLAKLLHQSGAVILGSDIHQPNVARAKEELGVIPVASDSILRSECDVLAPCALGGILNQHSISQLNTRIIAGAANNQLATDEDDHRLNERGVVYCPDFAINAGGIIEVFHQRQGSNKARRTQALEQIANTIDQILMTSQKTGLGTQQVAISLAEERLETASHYAPPRVTKAG